MVNLVSNIIQPEIIKSVSKPIVRKSIKKGVMPSLRQIDKWFKNSLTIKIDLNNCNHQIQGRIKKIGPYRSDTKADALIWLENCPFGVYVRDINHFEVEKIEEIPFPMIFDPSCESAEKIKTVTLIANEKKFVVNQERLIEEVPYFRGMLYGGFRESLQNEKDVSKLLSPQQLELILNYLDDQVQIENSNVIDLFIVSDILLINKISYKIREHLVKSLTLEEIQSLKSNVNYPPLQDFLSDINNEIKKFFYLNQHSCPVNQEINRLLNGKETLIDVKQLSLECQKITFSGSKPHLGINGIIDVLRLVEILGARIESLNIYNVNDPDLPLLIDYLKANPQIKSLNISRNGLTDQGASLLAETMNLLPSLKILKISNHKISDEGLKLIADALESNTSVEKVNLSCNKFSSEGFDYLAQKLEKNKTLKSLKLTACGIGTGIKKNGKYVQAFSNNTSLRKLYIGNNCLYDEDAEGISKIISNNNFLKVIDLWGNRISLEGRKKLETSLLNNKTLTKIRVNSVTNEQDGCYRPATIDLRGKFS
jgi:hypothetical protein